MAVKNFTRKNFFPSSVIVAGGVGAGVATNGIDTTQPVQALAGEMNDIIFHLAEFIRDSVEIKEMVEALGGSPTPLSWGELYTALQSGVVDGAENNPPTFYSSHHFEVCKYFTLDEHASIPDVLIMSQIIWDRLTQKEKKYLQLAVKETVVKQRELWATAEEDALTELKKAGVTIFRPQKSLYSDKVKSMYESYKSRPTVYEYISRIQNLK